MGAIGKRRERAKYTMEIGQIEKKRRFKKIRLWKAKIGAARR